MTLRKLMPVVAIAVVILVAAPPTAVAQGRGGGGGAPLTLPGVGPADVPPAVALARPSAAEVEAAQRSFARFLESADGATLKKQFGDERLAYFQPYKSIFDAGVVVGGGSDHMQKIGSLRSINPYNPFLGMWTTIVRQPRGADAPQHPEQTLTREQALRLYTINNAFLTFEEGYKGSLEPGKLADFAVLDRDILTCPVEQVKAIQVEAT